jgi:hypothetical protein
MKMLAAKILFVVATLNLLFLSVEIGINVLRLYFG